MTGAAVGVALGAVSLVCLAGMWWLAVKAPLGWEGEDGFHLGDEPLDDPANWGGR